MSLKKIEPQAKRLVGMLSICKVAIYVIHVEEADIFAVE